jgi:predicted RNA-binding Zn-ribbon protein involved in translation (DUF1610 family)
MINTNKCPKCGQIVTAVAIEDITMNVTFNPAWKGFSFACPHCRAILGVQINPLTIRDEIIDGVVEALRRR